MNARQKSYAYEQIADMIERLEREKGWWLDEGDNDSACNKDHVAAYDGLIKALEALKF